MVENGGMDVASSKECMTIRLAESAKKWPSIRLSPNKRNSVVFRGQGSWIKPSLRYHLDKSLLLIRVN
jgi:hypothetical protein